MKRDILGFSVARRLRQSPIFAFLAAALLCGVCAGGFTGLHIPQANGSYVQELAALLADNAAGHMPSYGTVAAGVIGTFGWALAAFLLGALPGAMLTVALLAALRGFLLSFSAAAALTQSGLWGIYIAAVSIGVSAVLWLPALLLLCTAALEIHGQRRPYFAAWRGYGGLCLLCGGLLLLSVLWRLLAVPVLVGMV